MLRISGEIMRSSEIQLQLCDPWVISRGQQHAVLHIERFLLKSPLHKIHPSIYFLLLILSGVMGGRAGAYLRILGPMQGDTLDKSPVHHRADI